MVSEGVWEGVEAGGGKDMNRAISSVLFIVVTMVSGNIPVAKANDAGTCYFHGVEHPVPPEPGRDIRLESATLGGDNTPGVSASLGNVLNGALGGIAGALSGGCLFGIIGEKNDLLLIGAMVGATVGGYLGSRSDSGYVTAGSVAVIGAFVGMLYVAMRRFTE